MIGKAAANATQTTPHDPQTQPIEDGTSVGSSQFSYHGQLPAVAPLRDAAAPRSASDLAYGEVASSPAEDDAQSSGGGGPVGSRFANDSSLGQLEHGVKRFRLGDTGVSIRKVQQALFELDYRPINVNGTYDQVTADRVADYQTKHNVGGTKGELDGATFSTIEKEFFDHKSYANAARTAPPGVQNTSKGTDAKDVPVLLEETNALNADSKAEANAVLTPGHTGKQPGPFQRANYEQELEKLITETITERAKRAHKDKDHHDHGDMFSMKDLANVGNAAKAQVDAVFGSWAVGPKMVAGASITDRFETDRAAQASLDGKGKHHDAKTRARYFMNTISAFKDLDDHHSADRTRADEASIIDRVLDRVATSKQDDLLLITATWSASTDHLGVIHIQRLKTGDDNADRDTLWQKFGTLIHEYVHSLAHPKWRAYKESKVKSDPQAAHTLTEGVTEFLTHVVLTQVNVKDANLRKQVLGSISDDGVEPDLARDEAYADARVRAEAFVGVIGINNLYAAYFLGETALAGA